MTTERAIEILDPEHREHYDSIETVNEAYRMGMNAIKELAEIKGKLESGRLVELPCTVGDTLYELIGSSSIRECKAHCIELRKSYIAITVEYPKGGYWRYSPDDFGKKIFTTKEAAEARLKELQEDEK